jgi:hypothetical protein
MVKSLKNMSPTAKIIDGVLILLLVLVVLYVGYVAWRKPAEFQDWQWRATQAMGLFGFGPQDFEHVIYLRSPANGGRLYSGLFSSPNSKLNLKSQDDIVDMARQGASIPVIIHRANPNVYEVNLNGTVLASSFIIKRGIAISPDASMVAYEQVIPGGNSQDASGWQVVIVSTRNGAIIQTIPGFEAFFLNNKTLLVFTPQGIGTADILSGNLSLTLITPFTSSDITAAQSDDRTLIAWNNNIQDAKQGNLTTVLKVSTISPLQFTPLIMTNLPANGSLALSDSYLYFLGDGSKTVPSYIDRFSLSPGGTLQGIFQFSPGTNIIKMIL